MNQFNIDNLQSLLYQRYEDLAASIPQVLSRIYGRNKSLTFYVLKASRLRFLFGGNSNSDSLTNLFQVNNPIIHEYPTSDINMWEELRSHLLKSENVELDVLDIIYIISQLDI